MASIIIDGTHDMAIIGLTGCDIYRELLVEMCHHHHVLRLEEISLRQAVGPGGYQELRDVLLLRVQISRLKTRDLINNGAEERKEPEETPDLSDIEGISYGSGDTEQCQTSAGSSDLPARACWKTWMTFSSRSPPLL